MNLERLDAARRAEIERRRQASAEAESVEQEDVQGTAAASEPAVIPEPAVTPEVPPPVPSSGGGMDDGMLAGTLVGYGVAVAGGVMVAIFGAMALSEDSALAAGCGATASCTPEQVADADTFALLSDVGLGVALAGAVAGTVFLALGLSDGSSGESASSASIAPWLSPDGGGLVTQLRF